MKNSFFILEIPNEQDTNNMTNIRRTLIVNITNTFFMSSVGLSNILDSELIRREPAEGSHGQVVGAAVMDGKLLGKVDE